MTRTLAALLLPACALAMSACSEQTQADAETAAELAAEDAKANLDVAGEVIEEGTADAAGAISEGAADLQQHIEANDKEEPGPAPVLGDDLSE